MNTIGRDCIMQLPAGFRHQLDAALEAHFWDGVIMREIADLAAALVQPQSDARPLQEAIYQAIFIPDEEWCYEPDLSEEMRCRLEKAITDCESRPAHRA
jgi:hypothetical protein